MRFRPRYSLRTLFVLLALIALPMAWFASQLRIVRERNALQSKVFAAGGSFALTRGGIPPVSWLRFELGDRSADRILVPTNCDPALLTDLQSSVPEATVISLTQEEIAAFHAAYRGKRSDDTEQMKAVIAKIKGKKEAQ